MEYTYPSANRAETQDGWGPCLGLPVEQDFGPGQHFNYEEIKDMLNFREM